MLLSSLHWKWALKNLWRNPRRSIVTGLAIASGFMGLMLFSGYVHSIDKSIQTLGFIKMGVGHVNIYKKNGVEKGFIKPSKFSLTQIDQKKISDFLIEYKDQIILDSGLLSGVGLIGNGCRSVPFLIKGLAPETQNFLYNYENFKKWAPYIKPVIEGSDYSEFTDKTQAITITRNLSLLLNKQKLYSDENSKAEPWAPDNCNSIETKQKIKNDTSLQLMAKSFDGGISAVEAQVTGLFINGLIYSEDMAINAPLKLVQKIYDTDQVSKWLIFLNENANLNLWKNKIKQKFENLHPELEMLFYDEMRANPFYAGVKEFMTGLSGFFTIVISIVIALSIANSTTMNLLDRSQEFGTLRSLGLTPSQLNILLTQESILLSIISVFFGSVMTLVMSLIINNANITFEPPGASNSIQLTVSPQIYNGLKLFLFMTFLIGTVTFYLARKRTSKKVTELLTHN